MRKIQTIKTFLTFVFIGYFGVACNFQARAELEIRVTEGKMAPVPIAVTDFYDGEVNLAATGREIAGIVRADLDSSGLFRSLDSGSFIQTAASLKDGPRFADWRLINSQVLLKGEMSDAGNGKMRIEFRLYDVITEQQLEGLAFTFLPADMRRVAHKIADTVYKRVRGDDGYFDTKIVFVSQTGAVGRATKRLAVMDQDGANLRYLSTGQNVVMTPRFSPKRQEIVYVEFFQSEPKVRKARIYLMDLKTGARQTLGNMKGINFAPRFSPDGNHLVMSISSGGSTSLYQLDRQTKTLSRLTPRGQIDTSPCYSPDGDQIVFSSDRGGPSQIYIMPVAGGTAKRISFGKGRYYTPVWSPRGDLIAFTKSFNGSFYIGVMNADGTGERLISQGYLVEDPTWSPNGRIIMFTRMDRRGHYKTYTVDTSGYNERPLPNSTDSSGASWSPLID